MKEGEDLPEDVSLWPKDPFKLLGVSRACDAKELRRAYALLVRRFKPEHHPEQFRLIREAYDIVSRYVHWATAEQAGSPARAVARIPVEAAADELAQIDQAIRADREREAHQMLQQLIDRQGPRPPLALRMYWLLELWPALGPREQPADWLTRALKDHPHDHRCRDIYRRLVDARPREALGPRYLDWLTAMPAGPLLMEAISWRWQAAATLERWNIPAEDLGLLEQTLQRDDLLRARLHLLALDYLIWRPESYLQERCEQWLEALEQAHHLHGQLQAEFHRLDILRELKRSVNLVADFADADELMALVCMSWFRPPIEYRAMLLRFLSDFLEDLGQAVQMLDGVAARAPIVLGQFANMLEGLGVLDRRPWRAPPPAEPLVRRALASGLWGDKTTSSYPAFRMTLLQFCVEEFVELRYLLSIAPMPKLSELDKYLTMQASEDGPLTCVVRAYLLFHA